MNVVVDSTPSGQEGAKASRVRRLPESARVRYFDLVSDLNETLFARYQSCIRTTSCDESLAAIELKPQPEPRYGPANRPLGDSAFARTKAVINNVDEGRLTSLRCTRDDVDGASLQRKNTPLSVVAEDNDVQNLHRHGRTPIKARTVAAFPARANHCPRKAARLAQYLTSSVEILRTRFTARRQSGSACTPAEASRMSPWAPPNVSASLVNGTRNRARLATRARASGYSSSHAASEVRPERGSVSRVPR